MDDGPVLSVNKVADDAKMAIHNLGAFQLLEYQSDVQRCRFDKPSLLLRPYIADTSALLMLELGLMPVVTTLAAAAHLATGGAISADSGDQTGQDSVFVCFDICFFMLHS